MHLQLRSKDKKDFPGLFDITAAGHILSDETIGDGVREIEEELGIAVSFEELISIGVIKDQIHENGFFDNERCHVFLYNAETTIETLYKLQKEEVSGVVTADFQDFYKLCRGLEKKIAVEGFGVAEDGRKTAAGKTITTNDLVPHSPEYLLQVTDLISKKLKDRKSFWK
ncbi:NUDIX domain-containing protein [Planomicrobium sp. CPCC 101110]|nr:NUDIX domain-containing protein [Planomicrobium sp. CPCC 101110]